MFDLAERWRIVDRWGMPDPYRLRKMPISRWLQLKAWANIRGPSQARRDDFNAAQLAKWVATPYVAEDDRELAKFLPPWARPSDYQQWANLGPDPTPAEYSVE